MKKFNFYNILIIFLLIGAISLMLNFLGISICIFYNLTGIYCPSCGMTRAFVSLFHFNIKEAFYYNPMFISIPLVILPFFIEQFFFKIKKSTKNMYFLSILILIIAVWIIRLCLYFPNAPMPYNPDNLISHLHSTI